MARIDWPVMGLSFVLGFTKLDAAQAFYGSTVDAPET
jgi:hypothetical protein